MFEQPRFAYAVMALLLVLPQSLFVISNYLAEGIRFPFFRWQDSGIGSSFIPLNREIMFVLNGTVGGRSAIATWIWLAGAILLLAAALLVVSWHMFGNPEHARYIGPLLIATGVLFLAWGMVQYGPLLFGPSGYAIPVGVPILWYCGWQFMRARKAAAEDEEAPLTASGS